MDKNKQQVTGGPLELSPQLSPRNNQGDGYTCTEALDDFRGWFHLGWVPPGR